MSTPENAPAPSPAPRRNLGWNLLTGLIIAGIAIAIAIVALTILPSRWHPQLDVRNTGTKAVTILYNGGTFTVAPGETWHMRFYGGDTVTLRAGEAADAPSRTVTMPARNPKAWSLNPIAQRYRAEVNADDPKNIRFENLFFEEITAPPSKPEPWP